MGIMQNKVSRRIALGSIAGGLAGTAAVLHALKGKYDVKLPERASTKDPNFDKEWNKYLDMVNVPITELDDLSTASFNLRPQVGAEQRVVSIRSGYWKKWSPAVYPLPPNWYSVSEGRIATITSPVRDAKTAILVTVEKNFEKEHVNERHDRHINRINGQCVVVPSSGGVDYFEVNNGTYKAVPASKLDVDCVFIGKTVVFGYSHKTRIAERMKWVLPASSTFGVELPCKVAGFAQIEGKQAVKIVAEKNVSNREIELCCKQGYAIYASEYEGPSGVPMSDAVKQKLEEDAFSGQQTKTFNLTTYVDVETGVALRQECRLADYEVDAKHAGLTSVFITQVLDC